MRGEGSRRCVDHPATSTDRECGLGDHRHEQEGRRCRWNSVFRNWNRQLRWGHEQHRSRRARTEQIRALPASSRASDRPIPIGGRAGWGRVGLRGGAQTTQNRRREGRVATRFESLISSGRTEGTGVLADISCAGVLVEESTLKPELGKSIRLYVFVQPVAPFEVVGAVVRHT